MAKRKRLTPAVITETPELETKSAGPRYPLGVAPKTRAPIADVAQDASASAALTEIAQTLSDARAEGRLIQKIPLSQINDDYLVRDRLVVDDAEMTTLQDSLRDRGQQTAIEVTALDEGRYGLISGWRRVQALRAIEADEALAIIRTPQDSADAYLAMVEENEIRVGLSYYERARIVVRAVDQGIYPRDRVGLNALFHAASRPKRSKIGSFVTIVRALDAHLTYPTALTERTGLALAQALEAKPHLETRLTSALQQMKPASAEREIALLMQIVGLSDPAKTSAPAPTPAPTATTATTSKDDTTPSLMESPRDLGGGLRYKRTSKGEIVLSGPQLNDADFRQKLQAFLTKNAT